MNFFIILFVSLSCGLIMAQDGVNAPERAKIKRFLHCFPHICGIVHEFGALRQKVGVLETRLKNSETRLAHSETKLKYIETRLAHSETKLKHIETRLKNSETRLKNSENQILELQNKERTKVVFSAATGGNGALGPFNTDTTVVYRAVKTNIGKAYNQATGIFTAPVKGIYYFTFFYHAGGAQPACLRLMRNEQIVAATSDHRTTYDGADNGGNAVFLQLQQKERVYVRLCAHTHVWENDEITTFSGFLVGQV
ncbi:cerebellin-4-like [Chelmon rostratus]|uniref:cerebellin-4-like n=1 Tax=Chelmon rostratus TaxID=109905 RepID=UPI001BE8C294|nr:cerebellin-4-like [Chelmon rostratus]